MRNQKWIELMIQKKPELRKAVEKIYESILATDEDTMMASILLWDDGSIETHYRDYDPDDTSLKARSAVRIYNTISRSREAHKTESTEAYMEKMMKQKPDPDKVIKDAIDAIHSSKE